MVEYRTLDMRRIDEERLVEEEYYQKWLSAITAMKMDNEARFKEANEKYNQICKLAVEVWGHGKEWRYVRANDVPTPPTFKSELKKLERMRSDALRHKHDRQAYKDYRERSKQAREDLLSAGFEEWTDFSSWRAITDRKRLMELDGGKWVRKAIQEPS